MKKTSFSVRLMCYIVIVSMAAVVISTLMIRSRVTGIMEENMQLTSEQTMYEAVSGFQRYMKTLSLPIDLMCRSNDFKKVDLEYSVRIQGIEDSLLSALKVIPDSEKTYYATASGKYIQAKMSVSEDGKKTGEYQEKVNVDNTQKDWYKDALGLKARYTVFGNFTTPYVNDDGIEVFTVSQDLKANDEHVGIVAMDINIDVLKDYINEIQLMTTGFTVLADDAGNIIVDNEKNGIVFGDMILEELGGLTMSSCRELEEQDDRRVVAMRLDGDEFTVWMAGRSREEVTVFLEKLLDKIAVSFKGGMFDVDVRAGIVCEQMEENSERLICMAKLAQDFVVPGVTKQYLFYEDIPEERRQILPPLLGRDISTTDYGEDVSLGSLALNLFGKGADFPAQMMLIICKVGRFYRADDVLISILRDDFNSNYLDYQWHNNGGTVTENVRQYKPEEREAFFQWLGQKELRYLSEDDSRNEVICRFLSISPGKHGIVLPMYDNGDYMGNICILGIGQEVLENTEEYQNLAELGRVIQSQLTQQQHDIASKAKSDFLSRMSHEIRTPMNGIIGMTAIALQKEQSQDRIMDCLQKIQSSSNYLLGLINDILDMSKIESGKMKLEPYNFDLREMLDTIKELIMPQAAAKEIDFVQDIEVEHYWFVADKMRISQVLINLLGNAVKFTPRRGKVTLTVREVESKDREATVYFAVRDTGVGIAKEDQKRVFRSFEQAVDKNPSKQQGTGLGLSISSRLVQMMGNSIALESELGEGSIFSFSIPLELGENMEAQVQEEEISFEGCRILVVEDNELNAEIALTLLEDRGFVVDCVYDGSEAVERIRTTEPGTYDVILMDIMMPVMDGLEATRTIRSMEREDCRTIPIVAMSANAFDDDLKKSVECGMNGHLSKPVEVDKLYRTLGEIIHGSKIES